MNQFWQKSKYFENYISIKGLTNLSEVAAICTEDGLTEGRYCETCGAVFAAQKAVKATGHKEVIDKEINATYFTL